MLCAGITIYSPLKNYGSGPGRRVGIVGVGALGHFGILFAKALGAEKVIGISRRGNKREDVLALGADEYIATDEDEGKLFNTVLNLAATSMLTSPDWAKKHSRSLDLIVSTVNAHTLPLDSYLDLLRVRGTMIQVGAPEDKLPSISVFSFIARGTKLGGSLIGSPTEIQEMLQLAADKNIRGWIQNYPMEKANEAIVEMGKGTARFKYVLTRS